VKRGGDGKGGKGEGGRERSMGRIKMRKGEKRR